MLAEFGAAVIDSDRLVHEELANPETIAIYRNWWGERVCRPDGCIDRKVVANILFQDAAQRTRMEGYLYPRLERRRREMTDALRLDPTVRAIVLNSPLLYEFGLDRDCDVVLFIECSRSVRLKRAKETRGWSEGDFDRREKLQKSLDTKRRSADYIVENNSGAEALRSQVQTLFETILTQHAAKR